MPALADCDAIVCNTGPLIAIAAATGDWSLLRSLDLRILVPRVVIAEIESGGPGSPGRGLLATSSWIQVIEPDAPAPQYLVAVLDAGEAAVIATALSLGISTVAIDERTARRIARSCGLLLCGSLGLMLRARQRGQTVDLPAAIQRMRAAGIWIGEDLEREALRLAAGL